MLNKRKIPKSFIKLRCMFCVIYRQESEKAALNSFALEINGVGFLGCVSVARLIQHQGQLSAWLSISPGKGLCHWFKVTKLDKFFWIKAKCTKQSAPSFCTPPWSINSKGHRSDMKPSPDNVRLTFNGHGKNKHICPRPISISLRCVFFYIQE